ncbi:MAG: polysaccharide export protein [Candidatus Omnitrophica bacterium]|nr:polysaccharide export protein [Candidatus Omnitrophota bacterium]
MGIQKLFTMLVLAACTAVSFSVFAQTMPANANMGKNTPVSQVDALSEIVSAQVTSDYTLGKGDVVEISVRNQPEFSGQFVVGPDGSIQYNFTGDIKAEGLTKDELKEVIVQQLETYIKLPEVSVMILAYRSKNIYILGAVRSPGRYPMAGDQISLRDALIDAGLPTDAAALRRTLVIHPDETKPTLEKIDIYQLLYRGVLKDNVMLAPGDLVVVPSTVPSEFNKALTNLLAPISRTAAVEGALSGGL